eukprot:NODE_4819_length_1842_cov_11.815743.p1 GENE.NODE_4819_length_1842_cov_11.815743~~NODE_4819_length_1842_cov_11.815743.p1  ORF type:complete len:519 (+),score=158.14 NODE_4819_length_1842_cov_11.815743:164-1558(+)
MALRQRLRIRVEEDPRGDCPAPVERFEELRDLPAYALRSLGRQGITAPLPIQAQALPLAMAGRDVIGLAQTGSGKTIAFLLPAAARLAAAATRDGDEAGQPRVLILAPTRELAVQICSEAEKLFEGSKGPGFPYGIQTVSVYGGGENRWTQQKKLARGAHIVAATPGRLDDFINKGDVVLSQVGLLVLDEADRMLDMGFHDEVNSIAGHLKRKRQVLFFSATWCAEVQSLARALCYKCSEPVRISYGQEAVGDDVAAHLQAREDIVQEVIVIDCNNNSDDHWEQQEKIKNEAMDAHLTRVLQASEDHKILVFVSRKDLADKVSARLRAQGFSADAMHGGRPQEWRLWVLDQFRKGALRVLVCTDVLGRGIDIPSISHVVIHEMGDIEGYVHRIGRTARGRDGKGHALTFFEYWEGYPRLAAELASVLSASGQHVPQGAPRLLSSRVPSLLKFHVCICMGSRSEF